MQSSIVLEATRSSKVQCSGRRKYESYATLKTKYGETEANNIARDKKALQSSVGNYAEDMPHWFAHPDLAGNPDPWIGAITIIVQAPQASFPM